jgi:hypothetical protein
VALRMEWRIGSATYNGVRHTIVWLSPHIGDTVKRLKKKLACSTSHIRCRMGDHLTIPSHLPVPR